VRRNISGGAGDRRVGALDTWVGYHPQLENAILPQVEDLAREMESLLAY